MKKNYLFGLLSLFTLLFAASCQEEELAGGQMGDTATVTFSVNTPTIATRAVGDGTTATKLYVAVYENLNGTTDNPNWEGPLPVSLLGTQGFAAAETFTDRVATVNLALAKNKEYSVIFWAANTDSTMFAIDWGERKLEMKDAIYANVEGYDAFWAQKTVKLTGALTETVELKRPFAQLNIGTSDKAAAADAGIVVKQSQVKTKVFTTFDLQTGQASDELEMTYTMAPMAQLESETFPASAAGQSYLSLNYLLMNTDKSIVDIEFQYKDEQDNTPYKLNFSAVPVQRNYRTNIYGTLLTNSANYTVEIKPGFMDEVYPDSVYNIYNVTVDGVSYDNFADAVAAALESGKPVDFVENVAIDADETITIPAGKTLTLNLNGNTLSGVTDDADKNDDGSLTSADNEVMFDVRGTMNVNDGIITIKHESDNFGWNACTEIFYVGFNGTLNVNDATLENYGGSDMAYAIDMVNADGNGTGITVNVQNSTIKSSYIPVRVFNNGKGMNNVTIKKSTLEGKSRAFWVHIYSSTDNGGNGVKDATLDIDIFNPASENTFIANNPDRIIEYGFDDEINFNEFGGQIIKDQSGNTIQGVGVMEQDDNGNATTYGVYSAEGFEYIAEQLEESNNGLDDITIELIGDIDLSQFSFARSRTRSANTSNWNPIGTEDNPFKGTFDGKGYTIKNLCIVEDEAKEGKAYIGFFGYAKDATIKNVTFENVYIDIPCLDIDHSQGHIGAVAGSLEGKCVVENVTVKGDIKVEATVTANGASRVAVVAGGNSYGNVTMKNVHVIANEGSYLKANNNVGALAGQLQGKSVFENCSSNIDVTGTKFFAGGIIGLAAGDQLFTNCHTTGNITITAGREGRAHDHYRVGGIAGGWADGAKNVCTLNDCSYTGKLSGTNADGSAAEKFDYWGYVGRGYTLNGCQGSKVVIDGVSFVQVNNTAAEAGIYEVINADGAYLVDDANGLVSALEQGKNVILMANIKIDPANMSNAYGTTGINVKNGQTIDGAGHTLNIKAAGGTWDSGINTTGGLIKNLTVTGSFRGIFINHNSTHSEKVVLENVTITGTTYTLSCDQGLYQGIEATNCTFNGWTSFAKTAGEAKFVNCYFGEGSGYKYCRPYSNTEFVNCTFCPGYAVDETQATVTFTNCTWEK